MKYCCPHCKSEVPEKRAGIWPFCSERCKMADLGSWMREEFVIPGRPAFEEELPASTQAQDNDEEDY